MKKVVIVSISAIILIGIVVGIGTLQRSQPEQSQIIKTEPTSPQYTPPTQPSQPSSTIQPSQPIQEPPKTSSSINCSGRARCISGTVTQIVDGDTIKVDGKSIRFALTSTPELDENGGKEAKKFLENICPVGSQALVDEDDGQTEGSFGRILGVVYCNGMNLNEEILKAELGIISSRFCFKSEFSTELWAKKYGCNT